MPVGAKLGSASPDDDGNSWKAEVPAPSGWRLGRVFGVPVYVEPSAVVFSLVLAALYTPMVRALVPGVGGFGLVVALVVPALIGVSVLGHELGHLLAGRLVGMPATRISLHILGGETQFDRDSPTAGREALIAASGPAASLLMVAAGYAAHAWWAPDGPVGLLVAQFTVLNVLLAVFNLLPGLPLDGGWVLRAAVWKLTGRPGLSVRVAAWAGRLLVVALVVPVVVGISRGAQVSLVVLVTVGVVASQIWSGTSAALRELNEVHPARPTEGGGARAGR